MENQAWTVDGEKFIWRKRNLSYNALIEPSSVAAIIKMTQRLLLKRIPSREPTWEKAKNATMIVAIPIHWIVDGRSPNAITATMAVHSGLVARMGVAMDSGKCFKAKKASVHELPTNADLRNNRP